MQIKGEHYHHPHNSAACIDRLYCNMQECASRLHHLNQHLIACARERERETREREGEREINLYLGE